jgi:CelD/BcsL family acetyltransferase involved in cellulose biosynthesis
LVRVTVARTSSEIEHLRPAWEALHAASDRVTLFQSFTWNQVAARVFADRLQPFVVCAESDAGIVLIPGAISCPARRLEFLGDALFDYRDVLAIGDPEVQRAAWERVARLGVPLSVCALRGQPGAGLWAEFEPRFFVHAPEIRFTDTTAEGLVAAHRRLGRFWRRALRAGAELRQYDGSASALLRWIYQGKAKHLGPCPENLFCDAARIDFMVAVCGADPAACDVWTLEKSGHVMSALVTFRDCSTRRFYTVFYDPQFADYSPGNVLLFEICRRTLEQGWDCDLMTGEQGFKERLATSAVPLFRVEASPEALARVGRVREAPISEVAA